MTVPKVSSPVFNVAFTQEGEKPPRLYYLLGGKDLDVDSHVGFYDELGTQQDKDGTPLESLDVAKNDYRKDFGLTADYQGRVVFVQKHRNDDADFTAGTHPGYNTLETFNLVERIYTKIFKTALPVADDAITRMESFIASVKKIDTFNKEAGLASVSEDMPVYEGGEEVLAKLKKLKPGAKPARVFLAAKRAVPKPAAEPVAAAPAPEATKPDAAKPVPKAAPRKDRPVSRLVTQFEKPAEKPADDKPEQAAPAPAPAPAPLAEKNVAVLTLPADPVEPVADGKPATPKAEPKPEAKPAAPAVADKPATPKPAAIAPKPEATPAAPAVADKPATPKPAAVTPNPQAKPAAEPAPKPAADKDKASIVPAATKAAKVATAIVQGHSTAVSQISNKPLLNIAFSSNIGMPRLDFLIGSRNFDVNEHAEIWNDLTTPTTGKDNGLLVRPITEEDYALYSLPRDFKGRIVLVKKLSQEDTDYSDGMHVGYDTIETYEKIAKIMGSKFAVDPNAPENMKKYLKNLEDVATRYLEAGTDFYADYPTYTGGEEVLKKLECELKPKPIAPKPQTPAKAPVKPATPLKQNVEMPPKKAPVEKPAARPNPAPLKDVNAINKAKAADVRKPDNNNERAPVKKGELKEYDIQKIALCALGATITGIFAYAISQLGLAGTYTLVELNFYRAITVLGNNLPVVVGVIVGIGLYALYNKYSNSGKKQVA